MNDLFSAKEIFEERPAIREFDSGQSRAEAEKAADEEVKQHKFQCMVRQLLKWRADGERNLGRDWLDAQPAKEREKYRAAANDQWSKGNLGGQGVWL